MLWVRVSLWQNRSWSQLCETNLYTQSTNKGQESSMELTRARTVSLDADVLLQPACSLLQLTLALVLPEIRPAEQLGPSRHPFHEASPGALALRLETVWGRALPAQPTQLVFARVGVLVCKKEIWLESAGGVRGHGWKEETWINVINTDPQNNIQSIHIWFVVHFAKTSKSESSIRWAKAYFKIETGKRIS